MRPNFELVLFRSYCLQERYCISISLHSLLHARSEFFSSRGVWIALFSWGANTYYGYLYYISLRHLNPPTLNIHACIKKIKIQSSIRKKKLIRRGENYINLNIKVLVTFNWWIFFIIILIKTFNACMHVYVGERAIFSTIKKRTQYIAQHIDLFFKIEKITGQDFKTSLMFYFTRISARQYLCIVHNFSVDEKVWMSEYSPL